MVRNVRLIDKTGILEVETTIGTDYIMSMHGSGIFEIGAEKDRIKLSGHFAAGSLLNKKPVWHYTFSEDD